MSEDEKSPAQREAEALAEYEDRLEEWPSGKQVTRDWARDSEIPLYDPWTGRPLDWHIS